MDHDSPLMKLVRERRSIRRYLPAPVEREKILACLEAARLAPSAENAQTWRFVVIDDPELKARYAKEAFSGIYAYCKFAAEAPVLILVLAKLDFLANRLGKQVQGTPFFLLDIGIAGEHLVLRAEELGLGTCWIGWFHYRKARRFLKVPRPYKVMAIMAMGHHEQRPPKEKKRLPLETIAWFNRPEF
jgi:nitroreductase